MTEAWPRASQWGLGFGAGFDKSPLRDFDDDVDPLPLVLYEGQHLSVFGARIDYKLPSYGPLQFRLRARYANDGYEAKDSPYLSGMEERKGGLWLGGAAIWRSGAVSVASELTAATGDAEGKRFKLELNREFRSGALTVTPRIAAEWHDSDFVDYYYGVRANEVRPDRRAYSGDSSQAIEAGVRFGYAFQRRHNVFIDVSERDQGQPAGGTLHREQYQAGLSVRVLTAGGATAAKATRTAKPLPARPAPVPMRAPCRRAMAATSDRPMPLPQPWLPGRR